MAAEGIHLSGLDDARAGLDGEIEHLLRVYRPYARMGAILVDLPYFDHFERELFRYAVGAPPQHSTWGDLFHRHAPANLGLQLLQHARRRNDSALAAMALGHLSHVAVDWELHPLVNQLGFERLRARGIIAHSIDDDAHMREHREIEKFQSILFHERRFGIDIMGNTSLNRLIDVTALEALETLGDVELQGGVERGFRDALGRAPVAKEWATWARGYRRYVILLSTPLGRLPAPEHAKLRERRALFDEVRFDQMFERAVARIRRYVTAGFTAYEAGRFDESFFESVPEGSIDDGEPAVH